MIVVGLTGSIGMGKSTTAGFFRDLGAPVFDADEAVKTLYAKGGAAVGAVGDRFPGAVVDGAVDRDLLSKVLLGNRDAFKDLESIVHPLVAAMQIDFIAQADKDGVPVVVVDIPLLLENGGGARVDVIVVVTAPLEVQRERVLARPGMTEEKFNAIRGRQMGEAEKRAAADYVIETDKGLEAAKAAVKTILDDLKSRTKQP